MTYPQPHEGITGTERTEDDLLAFDAKAAARRAIMMEMADALWKTVLVGDPAPVVARLFARMKDPRPGDLVMETSTRYLVTDPAERVPGFGILLARRMEWAQTDAEWQIMVDAGEVRGDDRFPERAWYVQYGPEPEHVYRWYNADFIAIPTGRDFTQEQPAGSSGVFTRGSLVSSLADSGFAL